MASFSDDDLPQRLDAMSDAERDALSFGVIGLDDQGKVEFYSRMEREQSGLGGGKVIGLDFFRSVAPCMNNDDVRGAIESALRAGVLDLEIGHTGDFADRNRFFRIRAMNRAAGGLWLAHDRS